MSKYGFGYRMIFSDINRLLAVPPGKSGLPQPQTIYATIWDSDVIVPDDQDQTIINIEGSGVPIVASSINSDEDKFTPIRAIQCTIKFNSSNDVNMFTFAGSRDDRWYVEVTVNEVDNKHLFKGFLLSSGMREDFLPHPNVVTLIATDKLAALKDIPLSDFEGENPQGKNKIADYIAWCLSKTGLSLDLFVVDNIREESNPTAHWHDVTYLDAKTFEKEIGESEDCYTVLEKILKRRCFITQWKGNWWIMNIDEFDLHLIYASRFDEEGTFVNHLSGVHYIYQIGFNEQLYPSFFSQEMTAVETERPYNTVRLDYNYRSPREIVCNTDFSRGDFLANIAPTGEDEENGITEVEALDPECWTYEKGWPVESQDSDFYIKVGYNENGYEVERYLHFPVTNSEAYYYARTDEMIDVGQSDKIGIDIDVKYSSDLGGGSDHFIISQLQIRLHGVDGTNWTLHAAGGSGSSDPGPRWVQSNAGWTTNNEWVTLEGEAENVDFREWQTVSVESAACPIAGKIEIFLMNNFNPHSQEKSFSALRIEYIPFINGTYRRYTGQYQKVSIASLGFKGKIEDEIFISDSPRPIFKGALFKVGMGGFVLTQNWYNAAVFTSGLPADEFLHPFGETQIKALWNQYRNGYRIFQAHIQGLDTDSLDSNGWVNIPAQMHKFLIQDSSPHSNNRYFMLVNPHQDIRLHEWTGTLLEVYNTINGKVYDDPHEFRYISSDR